MNWNDVIAKADDFAKQGKSSDGIKYILDRLPKDIKDYQLAPIFRFASVHGQYESVYHLLSQYISEGKKRRLNNSYANAWALDLLRKQKKYELYLYLIKSLDDKNTAVSCYYKQLAESLHDEAFLTSYQNEKDLHDIFAISIEQANIDHKEVTFEFLSKSARQYIANPYEYETVFNLQAKIFKFIKTKLHSTKNVILANLLFGYIDELKSLDLISCFNKSNIREIYAVLAIKKDGTQQFLKKLSVDSDISNAISKFEPHVILALEKIFAAQPNSDSVKCIEDWVKNIPNRFSKSDINKLRNIFDQIIIKHRDAEEILDWYIENREHSDQFIRLPYFEPRDKLFAPNLMLGRKLRIGVCISGQLRGYRQAFNSINEYLLKDIEPVIFVDTWQKIGRRSPEPAQAYRVFSGDFMYAYQSVANAIGYSAMLARYPSLTNLDSFESVDAECLAKFYSCKIDHVRVEDDENGKYKNFTNPQKMYHKIQGVHSMLEQSGIEVDGVLRIRPDKSVIMRYTEFKWHELIKKSHLNNVLFADLPASIHPTSGFVVGDQVAISTLELMHMYANAEKTTCNIEGYKWVDWPTIARAHANIAHALWINNVTIEKAPIQWGKLMEPEVLSSQDVFNLLNKDLTFRSNDLNDDILYKAAKKDLA